MKGFAEGRAGALDRPQGSGCLRDLAAGRLGEQLKRLRLERRLTLGGVEVLSAGHGERINKSYLFRVERGAVLPSLTRLIVLTKVLGVRLPTLVETIESALDERAQTEAADDHMRGQPFEVLRERGLIAAKDGRVAEAVRYLRAACESAGESPAGSSTAPVSASAPAQLRYELADTLRNAGRFNLARREAEKALEESDSQGILRDRILVSLAACYARCGQRALAREILAGLLARKEDLPADTLAAAYEEAGAASLESAPRQAAAHFRAALSARRRSLSPADHCRLLIRIGVAECCAGRHDRALRPLAEARDLSRRRQLGYLAAQACSEIGKTLYLKADRAGAKAALYEANSLAREGMYYDRLFVNHFYQRRMARDEGDAATARTIESSLRFFASRLGEEIPEVRDFREERNTEGRDEEPIPPGAEDHQAHQ